MALTGNKYFNILGHMRNNPIKNILFVSKSKGLGGGETGLINLMKAIPVDYHVKLLLFSKKAFFAYAKNNCINVESVSKMNLLKIIVLFKKNQYIVYNDCFTLSIYGLLSRLLRKRVIWVAHGQTNSYLKLLPIAMFPHRVICVSTWVKKYYNKFRIIDKKLALNGIGIDINRFRSKAKEIYSNKAKKIISIIGRFQKVKNHGAFLRIAQLLLNQSKDKYEFRIIGSNTFEIKEDEIEIKKIINTIKNNPALSGKLRFVPFTEDIVPLILESDFIIQPSLFESFGLVIIEAMACEKVVLATDIGGPKDIITHEEDGYLISPHYPEKYANVIIELVNDPNKYYGIAKKARKKIIEKFRSEFIADKFIRIINTIN